MVFWPAFEVLNHYTLGGMVEAGLGVTVLPSMALSMLSNPLLKTAVITNPGITREVGIIQRRDHACTPAVDAFLQTLSETFAPPTGHNNTRSRSEKRRQLEVVLRMGCDVHGAIFVSSVIILNNMEGSLSVYERWESRYGVSEYIFEKAPNYFLASCKNLLPASGRALAVADGEGRNGVWLAENSLDVLSIDFSPTAQLKAKALARERGVSVVFEIADVHSWAYPESAFDVVVEIFTQFSTPSERARKWAGMQKALKPGGLMIIQGYTPRQLHYGTGGPKEVENLYTRAMLGEAFRGFRDMQIVEEDVEMYEGTSHGGMSAVINFTARFHTT